MAVTAQSIILRAAETLQDLAATRWSTAELVRYLNDGQRELGVYRPDAVSTNATVDLAVGAKQALPANGFKLLDILRNDSATSRRAVRLASRQLLDAHIPSWYNQAGALEIQHFVYDPRDPLVFYVYPPASTGAKVYMIYAAHPTPIAEPNAGTTFSAVSGNISVPDIYANALLDYVLYRAFAKDTEFAGDASRAAAHYQAFQNAVTVEANATAVASPKG